MKDISTFYGAYVTLEEQYFVFPATAELSFKLCLKPEHLISFLTFANYNLTDRQADCILGQCRNKSKLST